MAERIIDMEEIKNGRNISDKNLSKTDIWCYMPDSVLLSIFQYFTPKELLTVGEVCTSWQRVSRDEFLWKDLFYQTYKIDHNVSIMPGKYSLFFLYTNYVY